MTDEEYNKYKMVLNVSRGCDECRYRQEDQEHGAITILGMIPTYIRENNWATYISDPSVLYKETNGIRTKNIPTKNTLPQLPEEIVDKIIMMAYDLAKHPVSTIIKFEQERRLTTFPIDFDKDVNRYYGGLYKIYGLEETCFLKWWLDNNINNMKNRLCRDHIINFIDKKMKKAIEFEN